MLENNMEIVGNNKPLVALFKNPLGYYMYDTGTNLIIKIEKNLFEELSQILKTGIINTYSEQYEDIKNLEENGFITNKRVEKIQHHYDETIEGILNDNCEYLILQVTRNCNLRCAYCPYTNPANSQRTHSKMSMTFDIAKKAIDFYKSKSGSQKIISIGFYGGEPLLEVDLMEKCIEYANDVFNGREVRYNLTTNGTLLNDENIRFLIKNNINVLVSLDGDKESHNKNRKFAYSSEGSFDIILENLNHIFINYPDFYKFNIRYNIVMDNSNNFKCIDKFFSNTEFFNPSAISSGFIDLRNSNFKIESDKLFIEDYTYEKFKLFLYLVGRISKKDVSVLLAPMQSQISKLEQYVNRPSIIPSCGHPGGPCIPGKRKLFVSLEGNYYPCEKVNENNKQFIIGDIENGYNVDQIKKLLNIGNISAEECKKCWLFRLCTICSLFCDSNLDIEKEKKLKYCEEVKRARSMEINKYIVLSHYGYEFEEDDYE